MPDSDQPQIQKIASSRIDLSDRLYSISENRWNEALLLESIRTMGIVSPVHVQEKRNGTVRIVSGFRRVEAAVTAGLALIPGLIYSQDSDLDLFILALHENLVCRPLEDAEKAMAVWKLFDRFQLSKEEILQRYLPMLDIPATRFHLEQFLRIAQLPDLLRRSLALLTPEMALKMSGWKQSEQRFLLELLARYPIGHSRLRLLFEMLDDLRAGESIATSGIDCPLLEVWSKSGADQIERDPQVSTPEFWPAVFKVLRRLRFPALTKQETRYASLRASLRIPPRIQFNLPPNFEGTRISVAFSVTDSRELEELAGQLVEISHRPELDAIFELL